MRNKYTSIDSSCRFVQFSILLVGLPEGGWYECSYISDAMVNGEQRDLQSRSDDSTDFEYAIFILSILLILFCMMKKTFFMHA